MVIKVISWKTVRRVMTGGLARNVNDPVRPDSHVSANDVQTCRTSSSRGSSDRFDPVRSGSAFSLQFVMDREALHVRGDAKLFELSSSDGERVSRQWACPICFTRLFNTNSGRPGMAVVRAGTLDRSDELRIAAHIWTQRKLSGVTIPDDVPTWPERASPAELDAALSNR